MPEDIIEIPAESKVIYLGILRYHKLTVIRQLDPNFLFINGDPVGSGLLLSSGARVMAPDSWAGVIGFARDRYGNRWAIFSYDEMFAAAACYKGESRAEFYPTMQPDQYYKLNAEGKLPKPITDLCKLKV